MYCTNCGTALKNHGDSFCPSCGYAVAQDAESKKPSRRFFADMFYNKRRKPLRILAVSILTTAILLFLLIAFCFHSNAIAGYWISNDHYVGAVFLKDHTCYTGSSGKCTYQTSKDTVTIKTSSGKTSQYTFSVQNGVLTLTGEGSTIKFVHMTADQAAQVKQNLKLK